MRDSSPLTPTRSRSGRRAGLLAALSVSATLGVSALGCETSPDATAPVDAAPPVDATAPVDAAAPPDLPTPPPYDGGGCPAGMAEVPAGTFEMGGTQNVDEGPLRAVSVRAFCMDVTEVTVDAYAACLAAGACSATAAVAQCNAGVAGRGAHPINCVTFEQARRYCAFAGKRLPTEEEWEYAARGDDGRIYPWGGYVPTANACWSGAGNDLGVGDRRSTCPVGSFPAGASPFGLQDMAGNVMEWTGSGYSARYDLPRDPATPVYRGGAWSHSDPRLLRVTTRVRGSTTDANNAIGLRCAR